jgi:hypothetical protein
MFVKKEKQDTRDLDKGACTQKGVIPSKYTLFFI